MVRKRDRFWEYAEELNGRFKCKFCKREFPGGATRIKSHLARAKGRDIVICTEVPKEVQEEASLTIEPKKKLKGASTSNKDKEREISSTSISKDEMSSRVFEKSKAEYRVDISLGVFVEGLLAKLKSVVIGQHISFELGFKEGLIDELGFKEGLIDLLILLTQIQLVLNDAEKREASDDFVRSWLAELRCVAYGIDGVLDEFGYNILQKKVLNYSSPSNDIIKMANKIKTINESLNGLKRDIASCDVRAKFVNSIPEISFNMEIDSLDSFLDDLKVNQNVGNNIVEATYCDSVTEITETFTQYELTEYDCWSIFKKRASANERLLTLDLEKIGKEIVKKCKRVPWAAEFLGRIMYFIHDKGEWLSIQNNKNWDLLDDRNNGMFHILKLGYDHLRTPSLKRCFVYCAILPIDYDMKKDELIQHWMAVGFLEPSKESNMVMEDIGNIYFNILLATSFLQNARKDVYGNVITCKMHDLVHNFALSISKSETLNLEGDSMDNVSNVQCLFVLCDGQMTLRVSTVDGFMKFRTAVFGNFDFVRKLSNFKCIRVLKLFGHGITELPKSIGQLIHLRLLQISNTKIKELPKSITELYNLQSLRIEDCCYFVELPKDLCNLINLRHIYLDHFKDVDYILQTPKNMGWLTCLQTLPFFVVGEDEGHCIKELGQLNQLSGNLDIYKLEYVSDMGEGRSASLAKKAKLFKLGFHWGVDDDCCREEDGYDNDEEVLEGLQPHQNLKSLTIKFYEGKKFPSWMLTSRDAGVGLSQYANLIEIILKNCTQCEEVPTLGHLPGLSFLEIEGMENVRCIGTEFYSDGNTTNTLFPALRRLKLQGMRNLVEWKDAKELKIGAEVFPCLEELIIEDCNVLTSVPCHFPSLQKLKIMKVIKTAIEKILNLTTLKSRHISDIL